MINFIILLLFPILTFAQKFSPLLDPNKYTVCAITINSDDEKKIFQSQAAKFPKKFNPVVELTDFSSESDWFEKACASKVKCDQLVISGHFAGDFFGSSGKQLSLSKLEKAGCSNSCPGILNQPHEVFLFGCNTLAEKEQDHRTPAQYLQVLLADGIPREQAELVVESRYGTVGDSNRAMMQRAFGGTHKQIYGFNSVGPSGKNVKQYLENYFLKTNAVDRLDKLSGMRMLKQVNTANAILAQSLKATAFAQCESDDLKDETSKKICSLQDSRISTDKKIEAVIDVLQSPDFLKFIPAINNFLLENPVKNMTSSQKLSMKEISENKVIKSQVLNLVEKTTSLSLLKTWSSLAKNLGMMEENDIAPLFKERLKDLFAKPLSQSDAGQICDVDADLLARINLKLSEIKNRNFGTNDIMGMSCLNSTDPNIAYELVKYLKKTTVAEEIASLMIMLTPVDALKMSFTPAELEKLRKFLVPKNPTDGTAYFYIAGLQFFGKHLPTDTVFQNALMKSVKEAKPEEKYAYISLLSQLPSFTREQEILYIDHLANKGNAYFDENGALSKVSPEGIRYLEDKLLTPETSSVLYTMAKAQGIKMPGLYEKIIQKNDFSLVSKYLITDPQVLLKFADNFSSRESSYKKDYINHVRLLNAQTPEILDKIIEETKSDDLARNIAILLQASPHVSNTLLIKGLKNVSGKSFDSQMYFTVFFEKSTKGPEVQLALIEKIKSLDLIDRMLPLSYLGQMNPKDPKVLKAMKAAGIKLPPPPKK